MLWYWHSQIWLCKLCGYTCVYLTRVCVFCLLRVGVTCYDLCIWLDAHDEWQSASIGLHHTLIWHNLQECPPPAPTPSPLPPKNTIQTTQENATVFSKSQTSCILHLEMVPLFFTDPLKVSLFSNDLLSLILALFIHYENKQIQSTAM